MWVTFALHMENISKKIIYLPLIYCTLSLEIYYQLALCHLIRIRVIYFFKDIGFSESLLN